MALREPPRSEIDPADLGLTREWLASHRVRLLEAFADPQRGLPFPGASVRQRAFLTNALLDLSVLTNVLQHATHRFWTCDSPKIELVFLSGDVEVARLYTDAQTSFMLPWKAICGSQWCEAYNAAISRGVVALLPEDFLNRDRVRGDLFALLTANFVDQPELQESIQQLMLEDSLGTRAGQFRREFELTWPTVCASGGLFPGRWTATLHRTHWPARLVMRVETVLTNGVAELLPRLLDTADRRVQPILQSAWLRKLIEGDGTATIEVGPEGTKADDPYLRGHMSNVGLAEYYDQIKPQLAEGLAFTLRERSGRQSRTSDWVLLPGGSSLLVMFAGDGVLNWTPENLGYGGDPAQLKGFSMTINPVGVRLTPEGRLEKVIPQKRRPPPAKPPRREPPLAAPLSQAPAPPFQDAAQAKG